MDPLSLGLGVVGLGLQLFGSASSFGTSHQMAGLAKQSADISKGITADEQQINEQKMQQTRLQARRMQLENVRNAQRARAQGIQAATSQGAQYGTGLQGGLAGVTNQEGFNALGINQNLEISRNIFGINTDISNKRMQQTDLQSQLSTLQGQQAEYQGLSSLGGSIMKAGPIIGAFGKDFFGGSSRSPSPRNFNPFDITGSLY